MEISVIITNYNYEKYIARAIRSVVNQSFDKNEYEIIAIDDFSEDNSRYVIESFSSHLKTIFNDKNLGLAASCNKAIREAMGTYIIRLDADDYVAHDWLKMHHLFLANNKDDMAATSSDYFEINQNENIISRKNGMTWPIACGIMYKTDHIIDLGLYDESIPREDIEFRQRFLKSGRQIYNIPVPLYRYMQHSESFTKNI